MIFHRLRMPRPVASSFTQNVTRTNYFTFARFVMAAANVVSEFHFSCSGGCGAAARS